MRGINKIFILHNSNWLEEFTSDIYHVTTELANFSLENSTLHQRIFS